MTIVLGADPNNCDACPPPCDLCESNLVSAYLLLNMTLWIDFICASLNTGCPSAPNPISPTSSLNTTIQLDLVPEASTPGSPCAAVYEGSFAFGDYLSDAFPGCTVVTGGVITFRAVVESTTGGKRVALFTYTGSGNYTQISGDNVGANEWYCDGEESGDLDLNNYDLIMAGTSDDSADFSFIISPLAVIVCLANKPTQPTVTLTPSEELVPLAA